MKEKILVTCYEGPDLDGFACSIAYSEYLNKKGKNTIPYICGEPTVEARFIASKLGIKIPSIIEDYTSIILTDASTIEGFPKTLDPKKVVEIIDHRKQNNLNDFPKIEKSQIELVGSAATLVGEKFIEDKVHISNESAILLNQAIISNTLDFQANVTTERDHIVNNWLRENYVIPEELTHQMFLAKSDMNGEKLRLNLINDLAIKYNIANKPLGIFQLEMIDSKKLIAKRLGEILAIMQEIRKKEGLGLVFASIIDLKENRNSFIATNEVEKNMIKNTLKIEFEGNVAVRPGLMMRKEIIPLIKDYYESRS